MVNCKAAASSVLFGANTICSRPLPKSGRLTRSPGIGEQQLLDHVADVIVVVGRRRAAACRRNETGSRCSSVLTSPSTRVCVTAISSGVPVGAQIAWLSNSSNGCPLEVTRVRAVIHCAVTHGPLAAGGGGSAQPATT